MSTIDSALGDNQDFDDIGWLDSSDLKDVEQIENSPFGQPHQFSPEVAEQMKEDVLGTGASGEWTEEQVDATIEYIDNNTLNNSPDSSSDTTLENSNTSTKIPSSFSSTNEKFVEKLVADGTLSQEEANELLKKLESNEFIVKPPSDVQTTEEVENYREQYPINEDQVPEKIAKQLVKDGYITEEEYDQTLEKIKSNLNSTRVEEGVSKEESSDTTDKYVIPGIENLKAFSSETGSDTNTETSPILNGIISSFGNLAGVVGSKINYLHENITYNSLDAKALNRKILDCREEVGNFRTAIKTCILSFQDLNEDTRKKLEVKGITRDVLEDKLYGLVSTWRNTLDTISSELESRINGMESYNETNSDVGVTTISTIHKGTSSSSHHTNSSNVSSDPVIEEVNPTDTTVNVALLSSVVGTITFKEIVILYETIGQGEGIPASLTGNYGLIGIIKVGDKYYYKMIDKDTNKVYYTEMNEKVEIKTEIEQVLSIKENAMMLNSTDIGSNNFVKLADPNTFYFVQNEVENNGITFANVLDSTDGGDYYIPLSDSVELIPLESVISSISSNK